MIDPISRIIHRNAGMHGPLMLMYHSVAPGSGRPVWPWAVSLSRFTAQLDFLRNHGWRACTMRELAAQSDNWHGRTVVITFDDGYVDNLEAVEALRQRGMRASWFIVSGAIGKAPGWPDSGRPAGRLLNANELCEMDAAGMEIGSHTVNHVRLPAEKNVDVDRELSISKATLENLLGKPVESFAYPYGAWDERCEAAVQKAGYHYACTTRTGWALRDGNPYRLRRLTVFNHDTMSSVARKLTFASNDVRWSTVLGYAVRRLVAHVPSGIEHQPRKIRRESE